MADVANLEIQIGAKIDGAVAGINKFSESLDDLKSRLAAYKAVQDGTLDPATFQRYGQKINEVSQQIANRVSTLSSGMETMRSGSIRTQYALSDLQRGLSGFNTSVASGMNGIARFAHEFTYLQQQTGSTSKAFAMLGGTLMGPIGVIFAVSALIQLSEGLIKKYGSLGNAIDALTGNMSRSAKEHQDFLKDLKDIGKEYEHIVPNVEAMKTRVDLATQGFGDQKETLAAYNKEFGKTLGNATSLTQAESNLTAKGDAFIEITMKKALAMKILSNASKEAWENIQLQNKTDEEAATGLQKFTSFLGSLSLNFANPTANLADYAQSILQHGKQNKAMSQLTTQNDWQKSLQQVRDLFKQIDDEAKKFGIDNPFGDSTGKGTKGAKVMDAAKTLKDLQTTLNKIDENTSLKNTRTQISELQSSLSKLMQAAKALQKEGYIYDSLKIPTGIKESLNELDGYNRKLQAISDTVDKLLSHGVKKDNPVFKQLSNLANKIKLEISQSLKPIDNGGLGTPFEITKVSGTLAQELKNLNADPRTNKQLSDQQRDMVEKLKAISNGARDVENIFQNIFSTLANGGNVFQALTSQVEQLTVKLAAAAATAALLSVLAGGAGSLASGISTLFGGKSDFGSIFSGLIGIKLASGGIAYGPTRALVGEYAGASSNPEVVAPLDKLKSILGEVGGNRDIKISGEFTQRGNDLVAVVNNTKKRQGRYN